jgi:putative spermidine/putrescine transport system ATP-binding protein
MMFQSYALFPHMTVQDNVGYGLKRMKLDGAVRSKRIADALDMVQLGAMAKRKPHQLSGGQRQRVALARAVAIRPGILLLDEPLTALDAALRDRLRGELNRLLRSLGITTIYVTHDQAEAMELGDRIVVMRKGVIAQIGTPRDIYFAPRSRFVAEFVGAANILEAPLANGHLVLPGGRLAVAAAADMAFAIAMVRPETIGIVGAGDAALRGTIDSVSFVGDRQRIVVSAASDKPLVIDAPNQIVVRVGDAVGLSIAADAVRLLPRED